MLNTNTFLVLGSDGFVGSYIYRRLSDEGRLVVATTRRDDSSNDRVFFDILRDDISDIISFAKPSQGCVVAFGIAASNINFCKEHNEIAYRINVEKTKEAITKLTDAGCRVVWFSSDNVFDGKKGNYTENDNTCPINEYGKMKAEVEEWILKNIPQGCILRLAKTVDSNPSDQNVFTEWKRQIDNNEHIRCIRGNILNFVAVEDVYQSLLQIAERKMSGLYNCCGDVAYSRMELATQFINAYKVNYNQISECDLQAFSFKDERPLDLSMDNSKIKSASQIHFAGMEYIIKAYIGKLTV